MKKKYKEVEKYIYPKQRKQLNIYAIEYVLNVRKKPCTNIEKYIAKDPIYSYLYAKNILKSRFILGETAIVSNNFIRLTYLKHFKINKKWIKLENRLIFENNLYELIEYSIFINKRLIKLENKLTKSSNYDKYLNHFSMYTELEQWYIDNSLKLPNLNRCLYYCIQIKNNRFNDIEEKIQLNTDIWNKYISYFKI